MAKSGIRQAGIRITIDGEKELTSQIRNIQTEFKSLYKEVELVEAKFEGQRNTLQALEAEYKALKSVEDNLSKSHDVLIKRGQLYQNALDEETKKLKNLETVIANVKAQRDKAAEAGDTAKVEQMDRLLDSLNNKYTKQENVVAKVTNALNRNKGELADNETQSTRLNNRLDKVSKGMDEARNSTDKTASSFDRFGNEVKDTDNDVKSLADSVHDMIVLKGIEVARQAMEAFIGTIDKCVQSYMNFENAVINVTRTVDGLSNSEAEEFLTELSREIPASIEDLSAIASQGGQYGISKQDLAEYTRVMHGLAISTNLGFENTNLVAQLQGTLKTPVADYERFASAIVYLGNNSRTTEKDIVKMAQTLASSGKYMKMSEADILGLSAALASTGGSAEGSGTAMTRLMERIDEATANGGQKLNDLASIAGMSADKFKQSFEEDAAGTLVMLIGRMREATENGEEIYDIYRKLGITNIREKGNLRDLIATYDDLAAYVANANSAWNENIALAEEAGKQYQTTASQVTEWENALDRAAAVIGKKFEGDETTGLSWARHWLTNVINFFADTNGFTFDLTDWFFGKPPERISWVSNTPGSLDPLEQQRQTFRDEEHLVEEHEKRLTSLYSSGSSSIISQQEDAMRQLAEQTAEIRKMYESVFDPMEKFSEKGQITAKEFTKNLQSNAEKMQKYSDNLVKVLEDPRVSEAMKEYIKGLDPTEAYKLVQDFANDKNGKLIESANTAMDKFNQAISDSSVNTGVATGDVTDAVVNALEGADLGGEGYDTGVAVDDGLIKGLASRRSSVEYMAKSVADLIKNSLNGALQIHSPSKVTEEIGEYVGAGLVEGMRRTEADVSEEAARMAALSANVYNGVLVGLQNGLNVSVQASTKDYTNPLNQLVKNTSRGNVVVVHDKPSRSSQSAVNDLERALVKGMLY